MVRNKAQTFARQLASDMIARSFLISLLLHFLVVGAVEFGHSIGLWERSFLSELRQENPDADAQAREQLRQALAQIPEAQLVFVEVDPTQAAQEPPKNTKYYSSISSVASNPETGEKNAPKITGTQDQITKTFDTLRPAPAEPPPEPQPKTPEPKPKVQPPKTEPRPQRPPVEEEEKPAPIQQPGETLLARAAPRPQPEPPPEERRRPRTVAEAKARRGIIESPKSRQPGGARKHSLATNLDVRATPFGAYDMAFIMAVQARWFNLLEERDFVGSQSGKVVLEFRLNYDGRIVSLRVVESEVSEMLAWFCQRAVLDPAPYRPFPSDMRRLLNNDYREIRFTFYYNQ